MIPYTGAKANLGKVINRILASEFMKNKTLLMTALLSVVGSGVSVYAEEDSSKKKQLEEMYIVGSKDDLRTLAGSGSILSSEDIEKFDATDINDLISQVPGVYIRYEDGYGLRPNIGVRGVTSDRSQKITLMEDGVLISPAPYTAPAAYYFPNVNRMEAMELVKGPASIQYGPHTIGGSLNMVTPAVSKEEKGKVSLTYGTDNYQKYRAVYGNGNEQWGYWIDLLHYSADGFKSLDSGGDTGFERNDINAKLQWKSSSNAKYQQKVVVKVGYADEDSNETYLGLSDEDFRENPNRRYAASQLDKFTSDHQQIHLLHNIELSNQFEIFTRIYSQKFNRAWNKFDGFITASGSELPTQVVLDYSDVFTSQMALIRGEEVAGNLLLDVTNNDREYGSHGLSIDTDYQLTTGDINHEISAGIRFHHDYVDRNHTVRAYSMNNGIMDFDGVARSPKGLNEASTDAIAIYIQDEMEFDQWKINVGLRYETIDGEFDDALNDTFNQRTQDVFAPGLGVFYQYSENIGLLAGVYKGFSPAGPGSDESVDPEEALSYEYGIRYQNDNLEADAIGFFSDYSNLIGRCRASDSGCVPGDEFNGGAVEVAGLEATARYMQSLTDTLTMPLELVYTYTDSAFQSEFQSGFSQWGTVQEGDQLPYLPENQLRLAVGLEGLEWSMEFSVKHTSEMLESPGKENESSVATVPSLTLYDFNAAWQVNDKIQLKFIAENITDEQEIVSRRPLGARPNQPRSVKAGMTYQF